MLARTHFIIGLLTFLIVESYFEYKFLFFVSLFVASVLPDIDVKTSKISKSLFPLGEVVRLFVKHRGVLHSLLLWFTVSLLFFPFFPEISYGLFIGSFLHIMADGLTLRGIKAFWPSSYKLRGFIRTGGVIEDFLFLVLLIFVIGIIVKSFGL